MGWTQFTAIMRDGAEFCIATTLLTEFFQMPDGYTGADVARIVSHKRIEGARLYRDRPYFTCFVSGMRTSAV